MVFRILFETLLRSLEEKSQRCRKTSVLRQDSQTQQIQHINHVAAGDRSVGSTPRRGKTSTGWFYGFKLHLVTNHQGELMNVFISAGNHDDRKPVLKLVRELQGKLLGDRGYIKKELLQELLKQGLEC